MKLVDANIDDLNRASRRGRARSGETQQLIDAIASLKPGAARAVVLGSGETTQKVRSRIAYAARIAGRRLKIAVEADRVLFGINARSAGKRRAKKSGK